MGKVIILEGPDGGGKSTIAKKLVEHGFHYTHEGPPPEGVDLIAHYLRKLNDSIEAPYDVVHDRLYLGEMVYGPIFRGQDRLGIEGLKLFSRLHASKVIHQYICCPSRETLKKNYDAKLLEPDDYVKGFDNLWKVYDKYIDLFSSPSFPELCNCFWFNYEENTCEAILGQLRRPMINLPNGTIGRIDAKYLFIADTPNHPSIDVPFFAITGSSGYFNKALELAGIHELDLAISNAYGPSAQSHLLSEILENLPKVKYIFTMGRVAQDWICWEDQRDDSLRPGITVIPIPHPSYLKRFKGHNPQVMADLIKEKLNGVTRSR